MLLGLERVESGSAVLPFVHQFYSTPSAYLWADGEGEVHIVLQGEGGEQGDAFMPLLFCVGQHSALQEVQHSLRPSERLFAFLDDLYVVSEPDRVGEIYRTIHDQNMWKCLRAILRIPVDSCEEQTRSTATLPLSLGGLGLRSAQRTCVAACWASWCSGVAMFGFREQSRCLFGRSSRLSASAAELRPEVREPEAHEPGCSRQGWQHEAASRVEEEFRKTLVDAHADRTSLVPDAAPTAPSPSFASVKSHLRMWPSTRLIWPPSRSLRSDWSAV